MPNKSNIFCRQPLNLNRISGTFGMIRGSSRGGVCPPHQPGTLQLLPERMVQMAFLLLSCRPDYADQHVG